MRLLFDENISWRLTAYLRPHCEAVLHVQDIHLDSSPDISIWRYAKQNNFHLLTKDEDFIRLLLTQGFPPKVVAVINAQVPVKDLAAFLLAHLEQIRGFLTEQESSGMLLLRLP
ncbi:DUF5615 family PIN-like protein [Hymenobacter sp.]|jgi:predicted nuclease of predicted toxin-antitoxin system|uniref:DUF5615 family PIN-like protein n=1 Tax=Hymenobacter sp. TaxID=1898978 RepID=UPI002EDA11A3